MTKKFLSAIMALSMAVCTFTGCSDLDKDGNLKEAFSYKTVTKEFYGGVEYSYKVRSDFRYVPDPDEMMEGIYAYDGDILFCFDFPVMNYYLKMLPEAFIQFYDSVFYENENISSQIINCEEYDIVKYACDEEGNRSVFYTISDEDFPLRGLTVDVSYPIGKDENLIEQLVFEWFDNLEYTGEIELDIVTSYDGEEFSIEIPSDLKDYFEVKSLTPRPAKHKATIIYQRMNNLAEKTGEFIVEALTDTEYTSAEEYLNSVCDEHIDNDDSDSVNKEVLQDVQKTEIIGYDGYCAEYSKEFSALASNYVFTEYAFEKDGMIYSIKIKTIESENTEQVQADFEKLIDCIKIK